MALAQENKVMTMYKKLRLMTQAAGLAAALTLGVTAANAADFVAAWDAAEAKRNRASAVGYEWRDTKKLLKKARKEAESGDMEKAMNLVATADEQSEDALAQQARESEAWKSRVPQ